MFPDFKRSMLASMTESEWNDLVVGEVMGELPTGTVTLLLADVEGSTRLWQTQPDQMTAAVATLLASLAGDAGSCREGARLFGAAERSRSRTGVARYPIYQPAYDASMRELKNALSDEDFEAAGKEGATLSSDEAIAFAQRGRGERRRPSSGWASLAPSELDVVRLVSEGLANKDIAQRL